MVQRDTPQKIDEKYNADEIDILHLLIELHSRWKTVALFLIFGFIVSTSFAFIRVKIYEAEAQIVATNESVTEMLNSSSLVKLDKMQLYISYLDMLKSPVNWIEYVNQQEAMKLLLDGETSSDLALELFDNLSIEGVRESEKEEFPRVTSVKFKHHNREKVAEVVDDYVEFVSNKLLKSLSKQSLDIRELRIRNINNEIDLLRANAEALRTREISRKTASNDLQVAILKQRKNLLLEKSKQERLVGIAKAEEALKIAQSLNIEYPTTIGGFRQELAPSSTTNINISESQNVPQYLMGTIYLEAHLERLKKRTTEESYLEQIAELNIQIIRLENDIELKALKMRKSDDLFIEELPKLIAEIRRLNQISLLKVAPAPISVSKYARGSEKPVKSKTITIIVAGTLFFALIGVIGVLLHGAITRRKQVLLK